MKLQPSHPPDRRRGFTWLELMLVLIVVVIVAGLVLPMLTPRRRADGRRIQCVNNLKNLGLGLRIFATDNNGMFPWAVPVRDGGTLEHLADEQRIWRHVAVLSNELSTPKILLCPKDPRFDQLADKTLVFGLPQTNNALQFGDNEHLSYFLATGANEEVPELLMGGDRNLTRNGTPVQGKITPTAADLFQFTKPGHHDGLGNVLMSDGSVQQTVAKHNPFTFTNGFSTHGTNPVSPLLIP
jgi:prepilin-type N-terminal cleavage/methylation domain-containing protein/prepilin-type processing-associated H-X9-DG protein